LTCFLANSASNPYPAPLLPVAADEVEFDTEGAGVGVGVAGEAVDGLAGFGGGVELLLLLLLTGVGECDAEWFFGKGGGVFVGAV
jgi:hypothetical protein